MGKMKDRPFKMYILIKDWVDIGHAVNGAAHAAAIAFREWGDDPEFQDWANNSFRKVSCVVTEEEFEKALTYGCDSAIVGEQHFGPDAQLALVFRPRRDWPGFFGSLRLYGS